MPATERLEARVTHELKELLRRAATLRGQTLTDFVVASAQDAAQRTIEFSDVITLTRRDQEKLVHLLTNPPSPNERLRRAAAVYKGRARAKAGDR